MNKYHNRKTVIDDHIFDSKAEGSYYLKLKEKRDTGQIQGFTLQPRYILQESFRKNGKTFRKIEYVADFEVTHLDGSIEVIDVKATKNFTTDVYKLKKKLFEKKYPDLTIMEVYKR